MERLSRENRLAQIWDEVERLTDRGGASRRDIAKALGVSKSPYLIQLINEVVQKGEIVELWEDNPDKPNRILYYLKG